MAMTTAAKLPLNPAVRDTMNEHAHQVALFAWAFLARKQRPELEALYAVPNAGKRSIGAAAYIKSEGLRSGVPDICLPVPRGGFGALYIELKSATGRTSEQQKKWLSRLNGLGNMAVVCRGWLEAKDTIEGYLTGGLHA